MQMAIEYRKLCEKDLDIFIEMRINQLREEGAFIQHVYKC